MCKMPFVLPIKSVGTRLASVSRMSEIAEAERENTPRDFLSSSWAGVAHLEDFDNIMLLRGVSNPCSSLRGMPPKPCHNGLISGIKMTSHHPSS